MTGRMLGGVGIAVAAGALGSFGSFVATRDATSSLVVGAIGAVIGAAVSLVVAAGDDPAPDSFTSTERMSDDRQS